MNRYFSIAKREVKSSIVDNRRLICLMFSLYVISAVLAWIFHAQLLEILNPFLGEIKAEMSREFTMDLLWNCLLTMKLQVLQHIFHLFSLE